MKSDFKKRYIFIRSTLSQTKKKQRKDNEHDTSKYFAAFIIFFLRVGRKNSTKNVSFKNAEPQGLKIPVDAAIQSSSIVSSRRVLNGGEANEGRSGRQHAITRWEFKLISVVGSRESAALMTRGKLFRATEDAR